MGTSLFNLQYRFTTKSFSTKASYTQLLPSIWLISIQEESLVQFIIASLLSGISGNGSWLDAKVCGELGITIVGL
jgi:hypothetical protein